MIELLSSLLNEKLFVASTLTAVFAYLYKVRSDSKKDARYVLYLLLDFRKVLLSYKLQMDKAGDAAAVAASEALKKSGGEVSAEDLEEAKLVLGQFYGDLNSIMFRYKDQLFTERFEQALSELAKTDPLRAYRIRSHRFMVEMAGAQEQFLNEVVTKKLEEDIGNSSGDPAVIDAVKTAFNDEADKERQSHIESFLKDLNGDLLRLGFSSGLVVFVRTWYRIRFSDVTPLTSEIRSAIPEDFFDRVKRRANGLVLKDAIEKHGLRPIH